MHLPDEWPIIQYFCIMRTIIMLLSLMLMSTSIHRESAVPLAIVKYYISTSNGDDTNNGTSSATPWKTIARVNTAWGAGTFNAGDSILFKAGDVWSGANLATLVVKKSGASERSSINVSSYGAGNKPQLNGFVTLKGWTPAGDHIYYSTNTNLGSEVHSVLRNGAELGEGRYPDADAPNKGYLTFEKAVEKNSITDNELPASPNWTGYDVVCRIKAFVTERRNISAHSGHDITVGTNFSQKIQAGLGYFITGGLGVLTKNYEWWYDAANHRLYMYSSAGEPTGTIEAVAASSFINSSNYSFVHFNNLYLRGANENAISVGTTVHNAGGAGFQFTNMKIQYAQNAVYLREHDDAYLYKDIVTNCGGRGIFAYNCSNHIIRKCYIDSINIFPEQSVDGDGGGVGIYTRLSGTIDSNEVRHCGYTSVRFDGDNMRISNNFVYEWCLTKNDGAAFYYVRGSHGFIRTGWQLTNNVAIGNGRGAWEGSSGNATRFQTSCYYFDNDAQNGYIAGNTGTGAEYGLYCHRGQGHIIRDNLFYNNARCQVYMNGDKTDELMRGMTFKSNTLISATPSQYTLYIFDSSHEAGAVFSSIDSNKYYRPGNDKIIWDNGTTKTLTEWKNAHASSSAYDAHSSEASPATVSKVLKMHQ